LCKDYHTFGQMFIALVGYMGAGKTSVGQALASKLSIPFVDLDHVIEVNDDRSITEIFQQKGEAYFRRLESIYLESTLQMSEGVLAVGGGTPVFGDNLEIIKEHTTSIYLQWSPHLITARLLKEMDQRPLLRDLDESEVEEFVIAHLSKRIPYYQQAHITIQCDHKSIPEIVDEILKKIS